LDTLTLTIDLLLSLLTLSLSLISFTFSHLFVHFHFSPGRENWEKESIVTLMCIDAVEKKYRKKEHEANRDATSGYIAYKGYMANNGVHPLMMRREQADYLNTFSNDAQLFYLAFTHVDGTDGIANGVGQIIMSYVGVKKYH
jgi:hypothetical protein